MDIHIYIYIYIYIYIIVGVKLWANAKEEGKCEGEIQIFALIKKGGGGGGDFLNE